MNSRWPLPVADLIVAGAVLLALLGVSVSTTALPPAPWHTAVALGVAAAQVSLVAACFMKLRFRRGLIRVFAGAGLFWLCLLASLISADYLTRR